MSGELRVRGAAQPLQRALSQPAALVRPEPGPGSGRERTLPCRLHHPSGAGLSLHRLSLSLSHQAAGRSLPTPPGLAGGNLGTPALTATANLRTSSAIHLLAAVAPDQKRRIQQITGSDSRLRSGATVALAWLSPYCTVKKQSEKQKMLLLSLAKADSGPSQQRGQQQSNLLTLIIMKRLPIKIKCPKTRFKSLKVQLIK